MSNVNATSSTTSTQSTGGSGDPIEQAQKNTEEYKKVAGDAEKAGGNDMAYYLKLQRAMMEEQQAYTAVSNIMKARNDASMSAINKFGR
jgi:hypothetical protein